GLAATQYFECDFLAGISVYEQICQQVFKTNDGLAVNADDHVATHLDRLPVKLFGRGAWLEPSLRCRTTRRYVTHQHAVRIRRESIQLIQVKIKGCTGNTQEGVIHLAGLDQVIRYLLDDIRRYRKTDPGRLPNLRLDCGRDADDVSVYI